MSKKIIAILLSTLMIFALCGCDFFTADMAELLSPPSLSDDLKAISEAISKSADQTYSFEYPQAGDYRSAVVQKDIDGDGEEEAFAFYTTTDGEIVTMNINVVCKTKNGWQSFGKQAIVASGVHRVDFCDLDKDGISEILVGWQVYGKSQMQLGVYSFKDDELTQRLLNRYTHFVTCDLDSNNTDELLIIDNDTENMQNKALLYGISADGISQLGQCALDSKVQSFGHPIVSELSSGKRAVYIDSVKGIGAITEVLIYEKGQLINPLYDELSTETQLTLRSVSFSTKDFNDDGILEIPVQLGVPSVSQSEVAESLYLTNWCSFNGETLTTQATAMMNVNDGYYYKIPASWVGSIAVLKDTDNRIREIYTYNSEEMTVGKSLVYFRAISRKDWEDGIYDALNLIKVTESKDTIVACRISNLAIKNGITLEQIKANVEIF